MKTIPTQKPAPASDASGATLARRGLVVGGGVAAAAAVAALALHRGGTGVPVATEAKTAQDRADGYRLSPHVLQYYETTKA